MGRHADTTGPRGAPPFLRTQRGADRGSARTPAVARERPAPFLLTRAGRLCALLAMVKLVLLLPILTRYGWHGDELYYLAAGQHLASGYVDFPPLVAVAGRVVDVVAGPSLFGVRLLGALCGAAAAVAAGAVARELGATPRLQVTATAAWIATPFALGGATPAFSPTVLELAATALALLAATRLLVSGDPRRWLPLALWGGIGMEIKYTIAVPLMAFVIGCVLWRRELVVRREAAVAALIALALVLPNVVWQISHGWISLDFASTQHDATAADSTPPVYAAQQLLLLGVGAALVVLGLVWLWQRPRLRPLALASAAPTVLFALEQGRSYYAIPAMLPALVAGCVALAERRPRPARLVALAGLHLALLVIALPLVLPILPERQLVSTGTWNLSFWKDELGWRELAAQTAAAWHSRTAAQRAGAAIVTVNYGTAGALSLYGPARGLPQPVSGHLSYQYWHPARMPQRSALLVGFDRKSALERCSRTTVLGVTDNRWHVANDVRGLPIIWCRLRAPLGQMWQRWFANASL